MNGRVDGSQSLIDRHTDKFTEKATGMSDYIKVATVDGAPWHEQINRN